MALDLVEKVKSAGVVGAGGAGFPTHVKLAAQAEYFIVNAAECEPLIETDKYLCRAYAERIVSATEAVALHLGASRAVIALKAKYEDEIGALKAAAAKAGEAIEICAMPSFYPAGDEQTMVQFVTGRSVPERGLPLNVGAVVDNVGTMLGIADALEDLPVTDKFLSVTGEVKAPVMLRVPIGTSVVDCIANAELTTDGYAVVVGGPMMGKLLADDGEIEAAVVGKTTGNILVLSKEHYLVKRGAVPFERIRHQSRSACIQCRMCTDKQHSERRGIYPLLWRRAQLLRLRSVRNVCLSDGAFAAQGERVFQTEASREGARQGTQYGPARKAVPQIPKSADRTSHSASGDA